MSRLLLPLALIATASLPLIAAEPLLPAETAPADDTAAPLRDARAMFKQGKYAEAAAKFAALQGTAPLTQDEVAAWAYCRVRVAADTLNQPACDVATAAKAEADVTEALKLAPNNTELQKVGQAVLSIARQKAGGRRETAGTPAPAVPADWEAIERPSFTVRFHGSRELAERVVEAAEAKRTDLFTRWSGPPGGAWSPRCEIVLHPTAEAYAQATGKPAEGTGHATVQLAGGKATGRRIDLRADDAGVVENTLPRELMHVVLADLFPHTPPPRWAEEGIAVLAGSAEEAGRFTRTLARCYNQGELFTLAALLDMKDFPAAEKITGFYCGSVSLVEFLVKRSGERGFTLFLRDCQRYSPATALKQHYQFDSPKSLQDAWLRAALEAGRTPTP